MKLPGKHAPKVKRPNSVATPKTLTFGEIKEYIHGDVSPEYPSAAVLIYDQHVVVRSLTEPMNRSNRVVSCNLPLAKLAPLLKHKDLIGVLKMHNVSPGADRKVDSLRCKLAAHDCGPSGCEKIITHLVPKNPKVAPIRFTGSIEFPPPPVSKELEHRIISGFLKESSPDEFQERGCIVCGQLKPLYDLSPWVPGKYELRLLENDLDVTRKERVLPSDPIETLPGPVLAPGCTDICTECNVELEDGRTPTLALRNGLWVGEVPEPLRDLTFAEQRMIARVRHNICVVRVAEGRGKLSANAVMFANPTLKVYHKLPPSKDEMSEVLAYIFLGPTKPTIEEFKRTPMLVRRDKVLAALQWLKINHTEYEDLEISMENLHTYELVDVPCTVDWRQSSGDGDEHVNALASSVHDQDAADFGTEEGPCPFRVHGLTGQDYDNMTLPEIKLKALNHMNAGGKVLGIGHGARPESMYDNPAAYPSMFPWLFPYGLGGFGNHTVKLHKIGEDRQKKHRLMYYDKRFQVDQYFPLIAFNHMQIKGGVTGSHLVTRRRDFGRMAKRLLGLNTSVVKSMAERLEAGERVHPQTEEEQACFAVLRDLDHVGGHVKGSLTNKKYMRNEIWSLIAHRGAPTWFITLSPTDLKHPLCLYYADSDPVFRPELRTKDERERLVADNPVAAARFFHEMVRLFLKHVLGVGGDSPGLFGETSGYYGTVEQQGRLTLHLHMLIWIRGAPSPQVIRDKLLGPEGDTFKQKLLAYLESCHQGYLSTGSLKDVQQRFPRKSGRKSMNIEVPSAGDLPEDLTKVDPSEYTNPTETLPLPPPPFCADPPHKDCTKCQTFTRWYNLYESTVDDLISKSNVHSHMTEKRNKNAKKASRYERKGCLTKDGVCKARFPRKISSETTVNPETGSITMKQLEEMINSVTRTAVYLLRCNTDTSCLLSGTAIKAVVMYVTNYITKASLKSHHVMAVMNDVLTDKLSTLFAKEGGNQTDNARVVMRTITNSLTSKLEMGSPMACLYILDNPDHYTDHEFKLLWWKNYVSAVMEDCNDEIDEGLDNDLGFCEEVSPDKVMIDKDGEEYTSYSTVDDYKYRPNEYEDVCVIDWARFTQKRKLYGEHIPKGWHKFKIGHKDQGHIVKFDDYKGDRLAANFVGGSLPRRDQGDREFYCCTMLTLMKPWRQGRDLKQENQSWDDAFSVYAFTESQKTQLNHFHVIHECHDEKDDYHRQFKFRKERARRNRKHDGNAESDGGSSDSDAEEDSVFEPGWTPRELEMIGDKEEERRAAMRDIERVVRRGQWLEPDSKRHQDRPVGTVNTSHLEPNEWKKLVATTREAELDRRRTKPSPKDSHKSSARPEIRPQDINRVEVLNARRHYFPNFERDEHKLADLKSKVVSDFTLNEDQERAFRIVVNHSSQASEDQLIMYLGGVGGTGKSQVIKAITSFFKGRGEEYRFMILGPTGTAAAAIEGSTYHWALGIGGSDEDGSVAQISSLRRVKENIENVDYIFLDEISMVGCKELYKISARLAKLHDPLKAFGGVNLILAGDFAQLPPIHSTPLYSHVNMDTATASDNKIQEIQIGRAIWLQVTTVVMLTKNMRQTEDSPEDVAFRKALSNMRYAACTEDDIRFLHSRIVGREPPRPSLGDPRFKNKAIIVCHNSERDRLNDLGVDWFARESGQEVVEFFSEDSKPLKPKAGEESEHSGKRINSELQKMLWDTPPGQSDHLAGKLRLCLGMPVIIRHNDATELCITKGQEGTVYGWDEGTSKTNPGVRVLKTLFIKLVNPPKKVKIGNLPENVVPMTRTSRRVDVVLPNDAKIKVSRLQVEILPFFAMTDYASQGKTRPDNLVNLSRCRNFHSVYTCLSRGTSSQGTAILQNFDTKKITKGISGWLRQEFRELETLNEITLLKYRGELPSSVKGGFRNALLRSYQRIKGVGYLPHTVPEQLAWKKGETPTKLMKAEKAPVWRFTDVDRKETSKGKDQAADVGKSRKRKRNEQDTTVQSKRPKVTTVPLSPAQTVMGSQWDSVNYSCSYDAVTTILWNLWLENKEFWRRAFTGDGLVLADLANGFAAVSDGKTLDDARTTYRNCLNVLSPNNFPLGTSYAALDSVLEYTARERILGTDLHYCHGCQDYSWGPQRDLMTAMALTRLTDSEEDEPRTLTNWFARRCVYPGLHTCTRCQAKQLTRQSRYTYVPNLLFLNLGNDALSFDSWLCVVLGSGNTEMRALVGVIYGNGDHFTCRYISPTGDVWFHDGRHGHHARFEGKVDAQGLRIGPDGSAAAGLVYAARTSGSSDLPSGAQPSSVVPTLPRTEGEV